MENAGRMYAYNMIPISARSFFVNVKQDVNGYFYGTVSQMFYELDVPFYGLDNAILEMDHMLNEIGCAQSSTRLRDFVRKENEKTESENMVEDTDAGQESDTNKKYRTMKELMKKNEGKRNCFIVDIMYRQNSSWQGNVTWQKSWRETKRETFRSVLELMKLIQSSFIM